MSKDVTSEHFISWKKTIFILMWTHISLLSTTIQGTFDVNAIHVGETLAIFYKGLNYSMVTFTVCALNLYTLDVYSNLLISDQSCAV